MLRLSNVSVYLVLAVLAIHIRSELPLPSSRLLSMMVTPSMLSNHPCLRQEVVGSAQKSMCYFQLVYVYIRLIDTKNLT